MSSLHNDSHLRSIVKGISYRLIGTAWTTGLSFLVTGSAKTAVIVGTTEITTKLVLYWAHERAWARVRWGRERGDAMRAASADAREVRVTS